MSGSKYLTIGRAESPPPVASFRTVFQSRVAEAEDVFEKLANLLVSIIVTVTRILLQNLASDVVVKLKFEYATDCVIIVLSGIVIDMSLSGRITQCLGSASWRRDPLILAGEIPPNRVELIVLNFSLVEIAFEVGHDAGRKWKEHHRRPVQGGIQIPLHRIDLVSLRRE